MRAIELYPYWEDHRTHLAELLDLCTEADLAFSPGPGLPSLGDIYRHLITTEEYWWHGGILGEPYAVWRPEGWEQFSVAEKAAYRAHRFPTRAAIREGLREAHAPVAAFLRDFDAWALCEKRQATWGESNTLRWIFWHLVEHDQHHRAQIITRLRLLGYDPPPIFPRPGVMSQTPAIGWRPGEEDISRIVPYWRHAYAALREAVGPLSAEDLRLRPAIGLPSVHDLLLHIFIWEDFLIRQILGGERDRGWWRIEGWFHRIPLIALSERLGERFPTAAALVDAFDVVHRATTALVERLTLADLPRVCETPWGPQTVHHALWYAREHLVHHRAQVLLRLRMAGRTPPEP